LKKNTRRNKKKGEPEIGREFWEKRWTKTGRRSNGTGTLIAGGAICETFHLKREEGKGGGMNRKNVFDKVVGADGVKRRK